MYTSFLTYRNFKPSSSLNVVSSLTPLMLMKQVLLCYFLVMAANSIVKAQAVSPPVQAAYWLYTPASDPSVINASELTHLIFASAFVDVSTFTVLPPPGGLAALQAFPSAARATNPTIKTLLSVAGSTATFSAMASSPASRLAFINSTIALARTLSFDGLDLDWEFPTSSTDMANFASLLLELRSACTPLNLTSTSLLLTAVVKYNVTLMSPAMATISGNRNATISSRNVTPESSSIKTTIIPSGTMPFNHTNAILTSGPLNTTISNGINVTVPVSSSSVAASYPVEAIAKSLDWIHIKAFDYHGAWDPNKTGEHTALFDVGPNQAASTDYGIRQWLLAGFPAAQAVLGLATYGRTWYLQDPMQNTVGAPAMRAGPSDGIYTYDEIKAFVNSSKANCRDDAVTKAALCYGKLSYDSTLWVGFDDPSTIATKVRYLKAKRLRGYFLSSLASDKNGDLGKQASRILKQEASTHKPIIERPTSS